jgi:hypothetical protein
MKRMILVLGLCVTGCTWYGDGSGLVSGGAGNLIIVSDKNHIIRDVNISGSADGISGRDAFIGNRFLRGCHRKFQRSHGQQR